MRISDLRIVRYGAIASLDLNFGDGRGLHVIHGPNEAGKSTCLAAIGDLLFGIPGRSNAGAVFGNDQIRLGAHILLENGQELDLIRRKGNGDTLATPDGTRVKDSVLAHPLGAMTRERFTALFGLNDETLRTGGADLLRANGDIGRLIVEAGGGLRALMIRLDEIDSRRNALFAPRRAAERAFYKASDAFRTAQSSLNAASLGHDAYTRHRRERDEARARKAAISTEQTELRRLHSHYEQLEKALPQLHEIARLAAGLAALADLAPLPPGMGARITTALETCVAARARHAEAVTHAELLARQTTTPPGEAIPVSLREPMGRARELEQVVRQHRARQADLAERQRGIDESLASLRQQLGKAEDADLQQSMPTRATLETIRHLADSQAEWQSRRATVDQQVSQTDTAIVHRQHRMASLRAAGHDDALHADPAPFAALVVEMKRLEQREAALGQRQTALETQLRALGSDTVAHLRALPCPPSEGARMAAERQHGLRTEHDRLAAALAAEHDRQATLGAGLARLEHTGQPLTPGMLAAARQQRDALWHDIRATYLHAQDGAAAPSAATRQARARALEAAMDRADTLSAQLMAQADRIARIEGLRHDIAHCTDRIALHERALADMQQQMAHHWQAFTAPFCIPAPHAATPDALSAFLLARAQLLSDAEQIAIERTLLAEERIKPDTMHESLRRLAQRLGMAPDLPLGPCVEAVTTALRVHAAGYEEYSRLRRELDDLLPEQARLHAQAAALQAARREWESQWAPAMQAIGLKADALPTVARALAAEWAAAPAQLERLAELHDARLQARQAETELARVVDDIRPCLPTPLHADAATAARELDQLWQAAEKGRHQREALLPTLDKARQDMAESEEALARARAEIGQLQARTQAESPEALERLASRLAARDQLAQDHARALHTLSRMTGGQSPDDLERAIDGRDLPELRAETARIHDRLKDLELQRDNAVRAEQEEETALRAFEHNTDAPQAAARREAAISSLHRIVEEYAELTLARNLIADAIGRVRAAEQDPLVTRAGQFLSLATLGAFTAIRTELDPKGEPVVLGLRHDGGTVPVSAMSAGTRDQLFLAFRLASVETYCRSAEPLPFIADDLLVQFDDARSERTLRVLADFARTTQVLLFTHHDSIRTMARTLRAEGIPLNLVELPRTHTAEPG
ncbi:YhaN family protein [Komagataeibacter sp. FNDCF1]|uniref:YhaN family protein n=1 Tax=Komagataeibacter sp. FNDCF1 TaxID=2878681 RepID=UPI001E490C2C|nr:YhaN family protein [Komagataeibacter sp. FNDCF1]MCE2563327.1 AAA family ATPase [Komagataeibacter sp. FNDCF1]